VAFHPPHPYWEHLFLKTAGLPVTPANIGFLDEWIDNRGAFNCNYNLIQLSRREPGSTRCTRLPNGKWARNYTDTQSAANAFADQLNLTDYPSLREALASGHPFAPHNVAGVSLDLQKWGAVGFQAYYLQREGKAAPSGDGGPPAQSRNVSGAWSHLMRTLARDGHATIVELQRATASLSRIERRLRRA
jgi:hypothetical protein